MPIFTQCENGHRLKVETALAGKRIRCGRCGNIFIVPEPPVTDEQSSSVQTAGERSPEPRSVKGELIDLNFPEIRPPRSKSRSSHWHADDEIDSEDFDAHSERAERTKPFDPGDIEQTDLLFEHHPRPVSRKYSMPTSVLILVLPLLLYAGLRFAIASLPPTYLAEVKRLAVHRANHASLANERLAESITTGDNGSANVPNLESGDGGSEFVIRDVCLGGTGRYVITYHAARRPNQSGGYVRVQDLQQRVELGRIPVDGPHISLAASIDTLVIGGWGGASLRSYQLPSLRPIQQKLVSPETAPISLAMGHSSHGPLYVINSESRFEIRELSDLEKIDVGEKMEEARLLFDKRSLCNASANGQTFCAQGSHLNVVQYSRGRVRGEGQSTVFASDHVAPTLSADGNQIFTPQGIYSSSLAICDLQRRSCLAAASGPFFVGPSTRNESELNKLWLYVKDVDEPIAEIPKEIASPLAVARNSFATQTLTNDKRLMLIPTQNCIVTIEPQSNETVLHSFDFDQVLKDAGLQAPYLAQAPLPPATRGQTLVHQVTAKGFDSPSYRLALGPTNMRIDQDGVIRWTCNQPEGTFHPVVVDVQDDHFRATKSFQVHVGGLIFSSQREGGSEWIVSDRRSTDPTTSIESTERKEELTRIDLPGIARQPTLAGGGRSLVLRLLEIDALAVIDLLNPETVRYLPISPFAVFTASKSAIVTLDLQKQRLERFDLRTLGLIESGPFPDPSREQEGMLDTIRQPLVANRTTPIAELLMSHGESQSSPINQVYLSMGFRADGPILYSDRRQGFFLDAEGFQRSGEAAENADCRNLLSSRWGFRMLPEGDGFVGDYDYESPIELRGGHFDGKLISYHTPMTFPSPGNPAYPGLTFVEERFQAAVTKQVSIGIGSDRHQHLAVPSAFGDGYVAVELIENQSIAQTTTDIFLYDDTEFHKPSPRRKLITIMRKDLEPPPVDRRDYRGFLPWDRRLIYLPDLKRLVTIPSIGNRVVVFRFDTETQQFASSISSVSQHISPRNANQKPRLLESTHVRNASLSKTILRESL